MPDFLTRLKASDTKLFASGVALAQSLGSGETMAGAGPTSMTIIKPLMAKGAPVDFVVPNPAFGFEFAAGAFGWSKRPNAALVVLDYLMSVEGQTVLYGTGDGASPRPNIPGSLPIANMQIYDATQYTTEVVNKYRERWNRALK